MLRYCIQDDKLKPSAPLLEKTGILVCSPIEWDHLMLPVAPVTKKECAMRGPAKLESFEGYDFILLNLPESWRGGGSGRLGIYIFTGYMVFVCDILPRLQQFLNGYTERAVKGLNQSHILHAFFSALIKDDMEKLMDFEDIIADLENRVMQGNIGGCQGRFLTLRRELAAYKKYYEQLLDVAERMEENDNGLLGADLLRPFQRYTARVERLLHTVENLREDVARSYESYQSQVDINLNKTMKLLTVITSVFLPLSLVTGWYGMNFQNMPELTWRFGYLYVMLLCALVLTLCFLYIKKKKL